MSWLLIHPPVMYVVMGVRLAQSCTKLRFTVDVEACA
jgi:hypothetical protein